MRDIPVQLFVLGERNRGAHYFRGCLTARDGLMCKKISGGQDVPEPPGRKGQKTGNPQKKEEPRDMQKYYKRADVGDWWTKREKPRGNGARSGEKQ